MEGGFSSLAGSYGANVPTRQEWIMRRTIILMLAVISWTANGIPAQTGTQDRNLVYIRAASEQGPGLAAAGVTLTAEIAGGFLALVSSDDLTRLVDLAPDHEVVALDDPTTDIFVRYTPDPGQTVLPLTEDSEILHRESNFAIMRMPKQMDRLLPPIKDTQRIFRHPLRFVTTDWAGPDPAWLRSPDPDIEDMVATVTLDWIQEQTQELEDFGTRHSQRLGGELAGYWIRDQFLDYGYLDVAFHDFSSIYNDNVVCVKPGAVSPQKHVIVGGHYDSITSNPDYAPGADDNATGTVGVLAAARAMAPYDFEYTVVFIAFSGEEQGLLGSTAWADEAAANGMDVEGALITDMLGYRHADSPVNIDIIYNTASQPIRSLIDDAIDLYVPEHEAVDGYLPWGASSDHVSFWNAGYRAILFFESSQAYSPYIHTSNDLIGPSVNDFSFMLQNVRTVVAATAVMARPYEDLSSSGDLPAATARLQIYPNPFNPQTTLSYSLPRRGFTELKIYCAQGRLVATPLSRLNEAGPGTVVWRADGLASGLYLVRLLLDGEVLQTVKLSLVR
jgi:hypothetical protein